MVKLISAAAGHPAPTITPSRDDTLETYFLPVLERVRETAHTIEDRVRLALLPDDSDISSLRILVVDDHTDAAESLAAVLELRGCSVRMCNDGWTALEIADEFSPHVCLLDLVMPDLGGLELGARLKVRAGQSPLVLIATTALGSDEDRARSKVAGFHDHLTKPIDLPVLFESIQRGWEFENRNRNSLS